MEADDGTAAPAALPEQQHYRHLQQPHRPSQVNDHNNEYENSVSSPSLEAPNRMQYTHQRQQYYQQQRATYSQLQPRSSVTRFSSSDEVMSNDNEDEDEDEREHPHQNDYHNTTEGVSENNVNDMDVNSSKETSASDKKGDGADNIKTLNVARKSAAEGEDEDDGEERAPPPSPPRMAPSNLPVIGKSQATGHTIYKLSALTLENPLLQLTGRQVDTFRVVNADLNVTESEKNLVVGEDGVVVNINENESTNNAASAQRSIIRDEDVVVERRDEDVFLEYSTIIQPTNPPTLRHSLQRDTSVSLHTQQMKSPSSSSRGVRTLTASPSIDSLADVSMPPLERVATQRTVKERERESDRSAVIRHANVPKLTDLLRANQPMTEESTAAHATSTTAATSVSLPLGGAKMPSTEKNEKKIRVSSSYAIDVVDDALDHDLFHAVEQIEWEKQLQLEDDADQTLNKYVEMRQRHRQIRENVADTQSIPLGGEGEANDATDMPPLEKGESSMLETKRGEESGVRQEEDNVNDSDNDVMLIKPVSQPNGNNHKQRIINISMRRQFPHTLASSIAGTGNQHPSTTSSNGATGLTLNKSDVNIRRRWATLLDGTSSTGNNSIHPIATATATTTFHTASAPPSIISSASPRSSANVGGTVRPVNRYLALDAGVDGSWLDCIIWSKDDITSREKQRMLRKLAAISIDDPDDIAAIRSLIRQQRLQASTSSKVHRQASDVSDTSSSTSGLEQIEGVDFTRFNISHDDQYIQVDDESGNTLAHRITHSTPALQLLPTIYIPPNTVEDIRSVHRYKLRLGPYISHNKGVFAELSEQKLAAGYIGGAGHMNQTPIEINKAMPIVTYNTTKHHDIPSSESIALQNQNNPDRYTPQSVQELSLLEGAYVTMEYMEQHPLMLTLTGMTSKLITYYRKKHDADFYSPAVEEGEVVILDKDDESPLLADVKPGQSILAMTNNMYVAPIAKHTFIDKSKDLSNDTFLLVRYKNTWVIRELPYAYTVGQQEPKVVIPPPTMKLRDDMVRRMVEAYIWRQMLSSAERGKGYRAYVTGLGMFGDDAFDKAKVIFKDICEFIKPNQSGRSPYYRLRVGIEPQTEEWVMSILSPEDVCIYISTLVGQQRLLANGIHRYTEAHPFISLIHPLASNMKLLKAVAEWMKKQLMITPWYLSSGYTEARNGKGMLKLTGRGNPMSEGCGYSFINKTSLDDVENKLIGGGGAGASTAASAQRAARSDADAQVRKTGTDSDLRKLSMKQTESNLLRLGMDKDTIKGMSRWDRVRAISTLSKESTKEGRQRELALYARNVRQNSPETLQEYRRKIQTIMQNQLVMISSRDRPDYSHEVNDDPYGDHIRSTQQYAQQAKPGKLKPHAQTAEQRRAEEKEQMEAMLQELSKSRHETVDNTQKHSGTAAGAGQVRTKKVKRYVVKITHSKLNRDGTPQVDVKYIRDEDSVKQLISKHRLPLPSSTTPAVDSSSALTSSSAIDAITDINRAGVVSRTVAPPSKSSATDSKSRKLKRPNPKKEAVKPEKIKNANITCSACGQKGHLKSSKHCPNNQSSKAEDAFASGRKSIKTPLSRVDKFVDEADLNMSGDSLSADVYQDVASSGLVKDTSDGRLKFNMRAISIRSDGKRAGKGRDRDPGEWSDDDDLAALINESGINPDMSEERGGDRSSKRRRATSTTVRRRGDPRIRLNSILGEILNRAYNNPIAYPFREMVDAQLVHDYYDIVKNPIALSTMREKARKGEYNYPHEFLSDVDLMVANCMLYNGLADPLSEQAQTLQLEIKSMMNKGDNKIELADIARNAGIWVIHDRLDEALAVMERHADSTLFQKPVDPNLVKGYYDVVTRGMSLSQIRKNVDTHSYYRSPAEFMGDVQQIVENSALYNGPDSPITQQAKNMVEAAMVVLRMSYSEDQLEAVKPLASLINTPSLPYDADVEGSTPGNMNSTIPRIRTTPSLADTPSSNIHTSNTNVSMSMMPPPSSVRLDSIKKASTPLRIKFTGAGSLLKRNASIAANKNGTPTHGQAQAQAPQQGNENKQTVIDTPDLVDASPLPSPLLSRFGGNQESSGMTPSLPSSMLTADDADENLMIDDMTLGLAPDDNDNGSLYGMTYLDSANNLQLSASPTAPAPGSASASTSGNGAAAVGGVGKLKLRLPRTDNVNVNFGMDDNFGL